MSVLIAAICPCARPVWAAGDGFVLEDRLVYEADSRFVEAMVVPGRFAIGAVPGPLTAVTRRVLAMVLPTPAGTDGPRLVVAGRAVAFGQFYDRSERGMRIRGWHYPGARAQGTVAVLGAGRCIEPFDGWASVPDVPIKSFDYAVTENPALAPFETALDAPAGYADALRRLLGWVKAGEAACAPPG
jgi:hypothetical protein